MGEVVFCTVNHCVAQFVSALLPQRKSVKAEHGRITLEHCSVEETCMCMQQHRHTSSFARESTHVYVLTVPASPICAGRCAHTGLQPYTGNRGL